MVYEYYYSKYFKINGQSAAKCLNNVEKHNMTKVQRLFLGREVQINLD